MVIAASDRFTVENSKARLYSDFTDSFAKNPLTGFLAKVENEDSVRQSVRNLVLTERTERFYRSWVGSKIWSLVFEPMGPVTDQMIRDTIKETIENCEPRCKIIEIDVQGDDATNRYMIQVVFSVVNIPDKQYSTAFVVSRVR